MTTIKRFGVMSTAKFSAVFSGIIGIIEGVIFSLLPITGGTFGAGLVFIVLFPVILAFLGFVIGAISAFLYNEIAKRIGGIKVEIGK